MASFIAPEDEVNQELEEWKEREKNELKQERKKKNPDFQYKKKDNKKLIDSEDEEIIQENLNIKTVGAKQKKRRLKKNVELDEGSEGGRDDHMDDSHSNRHVKDEYDPN